MGWLGHVPRLLNAVRIYLAPKYNHRIADIRLFEWFASRHLPPPADGQVRVAHVWDSCPRLIARLRERGCRVVLDVPIAPLSYGARLRDEGRADFLEADPRLLDLELQALRAADHILAPSGFVADELRRVGVAPDKVTVVEFGVQQSDADLPVRPDKPEIDFCFVGNVSRRKGVRELLTAWDDERFASDRLHLCGRVFPDVGDLIDRADRRRLLTPGFVRPFDYLQNCDVFVLPSWLEGSAKAVYEAMACGLPAIVTRSTGSVVRDGVDGFVIEAGDVAGLRDRMLWFKAHPERIRTMGAAARARVQEFTWLRYAQRVRAVYADMARGVAWST